ncbi:hypothetical protein [Streptococcus caecimuris]|jgi:hypothetical protein|uniref:hypothetical protein n=1 Tax=Streptococcus caecimuris TaxID=2941338 RepID=UPI00203BC1AB|nr:hypothetical protein [Streptococcus caecimuris]
MNLKDKYNNIFRINDDDYNKAKCYYDKYLKIFDEILKDNKSFKENLRLEIECSNPWMTAGYTRDEYHFNSLAQSDSNILGELLIENIEKLLEYDSNSKEIIQSRFKDYEQAFDGNFINPKVIILGINPKMSDKHSPYGLDISVYKKPFDNRRGILKNDYYFGNQGLFYANMKQDKDLRNIHYNIIFNKGEVTPVALWEFFPYASENETEWQKGYKMTKALKDYFQLKKILPSQIWMVCLLTYVIRNSTKLRIFLRKNNRHFREEFLNKYFELLGLKTNDHIDVLTKRSPASKYLSRGNVKPYYDEKLRIQINSVEGFFEDLWGITRDN